MKPFSLLVKPAGGGCNLDCHYCFYKKDHAAGRMSFDTAARMLSAYAELPFEGKAVALQGGEPLLALGTGVFDLMRTYPIDKSLQTNATLVTDEIAAGLARDNWLVGASLDGPQALNRLRGDSFDATVRGIRRLERAGCAYNILAVVSQANVAHPVEVYTYFKENFSTSFHQYIECTGPCDDITGEQWGEFLVGLFDAWYKNDAHTISIRLFDSIVSQILLGRPTTCSFDTTCRQYLVIEHDGSVYPCDFHVRPELKLGNVNTDSFEALLASPVYARFAAAKETQLPPACKACAYVAFCHGDCPRSKQRLCAGWKRFFAHALPRLTELAEDCRHGR